MRSIKNAIKGQFTADVGNIVALLVIIAIGALVLYSVTGALTVESGSYAENAIGTVEKTGGTVFNLMAILAVVVVAAVIIGVVMRSVGGFGGGGAPAPAR